MEDLCECTVRKVFAFLVLIVAFTGFVAILSDKSHIGPFQSQIFVDKQQNVTGVVASHTRQGYVNTLGEKQGDTAEVLTKNDSKDNTSGLKRLTPPPNPAVESLLKHLNATPTRDDLSFVQNELKFHRSAYDTQGNTQKILIVAHYRGGSSFMGQLFAQHPNIFYMFEPLHPTDAYVRKWKLQAKKMNITLNEEELDARIRLNRGWMGRALLGSIMDCDLNYSLRVVPGVLRDVSFVGRDLKLVKEVSRPYHCSVKDYSLGGSCVPRAIKCCQKSIAKVIKTIRIRLLAVVALLQEDPQIKIINYVRDPRGILASRLSISSRMDIPSTAAALCDGMLQDINVEESLAPFFHGRLFRVRYEDLALKPSETADDLYEKLELGPVHGSVYKFIDLMTGDSYKKMDSKKSPWTTSRKASETVYRWKTTAKKTAIQAIEDVPSCQKVFERLDYPPSVL